MSLIGRIRRLTVGRIESFLSSVEDPEVLFPQLVREMEAQVRAATDAEAKALAAAKAAERAAADVREKLEKMKIGAEAALRKDDEATAREAIEAQVGIEESLAAKDAAAEQARLTAADATAGREQIERQLADLRAKKDEILTRARAAKSRHKIEKTVRGPAGSTDSILDAVAKLESQVDEDEAELSIRGGMAGTGVTPPLEKRLDDLQKTSEVDKRLAELKARMGR